MLDEKTQNLKFMIESQEFLNKYDELNIKNNISFFKESADGVVSVVLQANMKNQLDMIDQTMDTARTMVNEIEELSEFFEGIIQSKRLDDIPITTKVYDISMVEKIRPQYLGQLSIDTGLIIDKYLKGTMTKDQIERNYLSDTYLLNCKKQMVKTRIPLNLTIKDMAKYDDGTLYKIDKEFISSNLLSFLRNVPQYIKEMEVTVANVTSTIEQSYSEMKVYASTIDNLFKSGRIKLEQYRFLTKFMYKNVRTFIQCASYLSFVTIKRINIICLNISNYKELESKILNYYPEGDKILHENVLDGCTDELDIPSMVNDVLINRNSYLRSIIRTQINKSRGAATFALGSEYGSNSGNVFDTKVAHFSHDNNNFEKARQIFNSILEGLEIIRTKVKDPNVPFDDIIEAAGFKESLLNRFTSIISTIPDVNDYNAIITSNSSTEDKESVYYLAFSELNVAENEADSIVNIIHYTYENLKSTKDMFEDGATELECINPETVKELHVFLGDLEAGFRQLVSSVLNAIIKRIENLSEIIDEVGSILFVNHDIEQLSIESQDEVSFDDFVIESMDEINDVINSIVFESYLREYNIARRFYETGMRVVYEDGLATSANATNNGNNNRTNTTTGRVTQKKSISERISGVIDAIKSFFSKTKNAINGIIKNQSGNLDWLKEKRDALINRNFSSITINVLPYEKYVSEDMIIKDIQSVRDKLNSLNKDNIRNYNEKKKLNAYLFSNMENGIGAQNEMGDIVKKYYKVKNAKLEVVQYKGAQAKELIPIMIDYCINFYSTFNETLNTALDDLQKALTDKLTVLQTITESVMYEAEVQASQHTQQTQNTQSTRGDTKASVQIDKKVDPNVKDGKQQIETDGVFGIIKWLSYSIQVYISGVLTACRDRNYDYLRILDGLDPEESNQSNNQTQQQKTQEQSRETA